MTAKEARIISNRKALTLDEILKSVKSQAEMGSTFLRYFEPDISLEILGELIKAGFIVKDIEGPIGERIIAIKW